MSIDNLPVSLQTLIQQGYLERELRQPLVSQLAYRSMATPEPFTLGVGETIRKSKKALFPVATTPLVNNNNSSFDNGITSQYWGTEQYDLSLAQYGAGTDLNFVTSGVSFADIFLENAHNLAEQAGRSVETLAQQAFYNTFLGMNTFVTTTLGSPATTVHVDDIRGFGLSWTTTRTPTTVSGSNPLAVTFTRVANTTGYSSGAASADTVGGTYSVVGVTADGSNTSLSPGGISGTLTFSGNVSVNDGTANNAIVATVAPLVSRPFGRASSAALGSGDGLTVAQLLDAKNTLESNNVPPMANGFYRLIGPPKMFQSLYNDTAFQRFQITHTDNQAYLRGTVGWLMNVECVASTMTPRSYNAAGKEIYRGLLLGEGALIEADYTANGYSRVRTELEDELVSFVDGVCFVTRPPLDRLGQIVNQSWTWIGGFTTVTDLTTTTATIPTSGNSAYKRGIVMETFSS